MSTVLQLQGLSKRFGSLHALNDINLDLSAEELLVVLGPTGAGKTTLLRCLAGLEQADAGRIQMAGEDITDWDPARRDVALVFQNFSLYPTWTVRQNLAFPLRAPGRNMSQADIDAKIQWAASLLHIERLLDRKATQLSGGEMQRVAIGRAIVRRPRLFLMDEPLTNLDAKLREALRVELVCLQRELKTPMIYVTHDQAEALSMGDRVVVLSEGQIRQVGTPQEVYAQPADSVVARQLGQPHMNLLRVQRQDDGHWYSDQGVDLGPASTAADGLLGIRPEHIALQGGSQAGRIRVVEDMGPVFVVLIEWQGHELHVIVDKVQRPQVGDTVMPVLPRERLLYFAS